MALDWMPVGRDYTWVDAQGPHKVDVFGMMAYREDGHFFEVWPVDPKGSDIHGWSLDLSDGNTVDSQGTFSDWKIAQSFAEQHLTHSGLRDAGSAAIPPSAQS